MTRREDIERELDTVAPSGGLPELLRRLKLLAEALGRWWPW